MLNPPVHATAHTVLYLTLYVSEPPICVQLDNPISDIILKFWCALLNGTINSNPQIFGQNYLNAKALALKASFEYVIKH